MLSDPQVLFWVIARATGLAAYAAICLSVITGISLRTATLRFLSTNRAVRAAHDFTPWLIVPFSIAHVVALVFDATARITPLDAVLPFQTVYGQLAIGLGTLSFDLYLAVVVTSWLRDRMRNDLWQLVHRLSYVAFAALFLHAMLSGTDLSAPVISVLSWAAGIAVAYLGLERASLAIIRADQRRVT
jgi:methionine sulfoxide reductase heme-binding subunit